MLYVVSFPSYRNPEDERCVSTWRQRFCAPHAETVDGHFTLVFGTDALSRDDLMAHVSAIAARTPPFHVALATSLIWPDDGGYLLFGVPEQGLSTIAGLHDVLYKGQLEPELRTDLPYLPHMTLGCSTMRADAVKQQEEIQKALPIVMDIGALELIDTSEGVARVASIPLGCGA